MRRFIARFRQAPMFSTVYVLGAALSVASVMLVAIFLHVKTSNIYPEYARDRLLYNNYVALQFDKNTLSSTYSPILATTIIDSISDIANVALELDPDQSVSVYVDGKKFEKVMMKSATTEIFNVYNYEFIEGQPFSETDEPEAVISDNLARKIFGTDRNVVGRKFKTSLLDTGYFGRLNASNTDFTVCGVFKEGSRLLPLSFAEIISQIKPKQMIEQLKGRNYEDFDAGDLVSITGDLTMTILPKSGVSKDEISSRIDEVLIREASTPKRWVKSISGTSYGDGTIIRTVDWMELLPGEYTLTNGTYPHGSLEMTLGEKNMFEEFDFAGFTKLYGLLVLVLLLVPALNLSSLISGNMDSKMSEMGIRKAFGARNSTLLRQVVNENLWLTGCGAILGVILAWIGVLLWKDWLFAGVGSAGGELSTFDVMLDPAMLFAPKVFIAAVVICVTLNLLSSLIPAWWALRRPAIDAIKAKS